MTTFATKADAEKFLVNQGFAQTNSGAYYQADTYYLSHGEYSQPEYTPRRYKDGWGIHGVYFYYSGTFGAPKDGRITDKFFFENA